MIEALGIAMVKDEADVIEAFVRHNLGFMDAMVIIDNDSVDGTREILVQLRQEGLPIILFDDPVVAYFQAEIVTALYRKVVPKFKPRFVFLLDADEFIVASSREALHLQLGAMRPGTQGQYYWRTYIPAPMGAEGDTSDPLRSITHRKVAEEPWTKSVIVTDSKIDMKLKIQQGGHDVKYAGRSLRTVKLRGAVLAHFPVRTVDQITAKALVGWISNLERNKHQRERGYAWHWKALYERIIRGTGLTNADVTLEALKYSQQSDTESKWPQDVVHQPVVPGYARLTARPTTTCTPLQKVVRCVDKIVNPESDFSGVATATDFLQNPNRKRKTWLDLVRLFPTGSRPENTFKADWHGKNLYIDLPPFRHLAERDRPTSVLDIGCGHGVYLKYFASQGAERIRGVDGIDGRFGYLQPEEYTQFDLSQSLELSQTFDLVICVEVIARIPANSERILINSVVRHAGKRIVFSGARPGQPGVGNINCQPISHWLDLFAAAGWYPCLFDSLALRSLSTFPWFRSNLVVLTPDRYGDAVARERLMELEQQGVRWKSQPAVITHPFTETITKLMTNGKGRWIKRSG